MLAGALTYDHLSKFPYILLLKGECLSLQYYFTMMIQHTNSQFWENYTIITESGTCLYKFSTLHSIFQYKSFTQVWNSDYEVLHRRTLQYYLESLKIFLHGTVDDLGQIFDLLSAWKLKSKNAPRDLKFNHNVEKFQNFELSCRLIAGSYRQGFNAFWQFQSWFIMYYP